METFDLKKAEKALSADDRQIVKAAEKAAEALATKAWATYWTPIGKAFDVGRKIGLAGGTLKSNGYKDAFAAWLDAHPNLKPPMISENTRAALMNIFGSQTFLERAEAMVAERTLGTEVSPRVLWEAIKPASDRTGTGVSADQRETPAGRRQRNNVLEAQIGQLQDAARRAISLDDDAEALAAKVDRMWEDPDARDWLISLASLIQERVAPKIERKRKRRVEEEMTVQ